MIVLIKFSVVILAIGLVLALASALVSSLAESLSASIDQVQPMLSSAIEYIALGMGAVSLLVFLVGGVRVTRFFQRRGREQHQRRAQNAPSAQSTDAAFATNPVASRSQPAPRSVQFRHATAVPADWYADPYGSAHRRYWDGTSWTHHLSPGPAPVASPTAGWLPDASRPEHLRWWDGAAWTHHFVSTRSITADGQSSAIRIKMTTAEWQAHVEAWATTGAIHQELWRRLSNAELIDADQATLETQHNMEHLSPEQGAQRLRELLASDPGVRDENLLAAFVGLILRNRPEPIQRTE